MGGISTLAWKKPEVLSKRHPLMVETMNALGPKDGLKDRKEGGRLRRFLSKIN